MLLRRIYYADSFSLGRAALTAIHDRHRSSSGNDISNEERAFELINVDMTCSSETSEYFSVLYTTYAGEAHQFNSRAGESMPGPTVDMMNGILCEI